MSRYRVIKAHGPWSVGHVFTAMPGNVGRTLTARGLVEPVNDEPAKPKKAKAIRSPVDRMMRSSA